jgi:hypothetical protein
MVAVAQLVEPRIVIPVVVGSSPISHPIPFLVLMLVLQCQMRHDSCFPWRIQSYER